MTYQFVDRYSTTGKPYPDKRTMCKRCDGMGCYPIKSLKMHDNYDASWMNEEDFEDEFLWQKAHKAGNVIKRFIHQFRCDGWHFVECKNCGGTGRIKKARE